MTFLVRWVAQAIVLGAVTLAAQASAAAPDSRPALPPRGCGTVSDLIGSMVLADDDPAGEEASRLAITQAGFNARASTATIASIDSGRRSVSDRHRFTAVTPWVRIRPGRAGSRPTVAPIELGQPTLEYYSRRSRSYQQLAAPAGLTGATCKATIRRDVHTEGCAEVAVATSSETLSTVTLASDAEFVGRWPAVSLDVSDVLSLIVSVPVRVRLRDGAEQPYVMRTGADYHEQPGRIGSTPFRNAGSSRLVRLASHWRAVGFATVSDVGQQLPGGGPGFQWLIQEPPLCTAEARLARRN
jgi:hypothetical protein